MYELKLDWLSFSWIPKKLFLNGKIDADADVFSEFIKVFPELNTDHIKSCFYIMDRGLRFYNNFLMFGDSWGIRYDNSILSNKGVNVEIHPAGLEFWFELLGIKFGDTLKLLEELHKRNCQISRIDLCYDDYEIKFTPSWYNLKASAGCVVSKSHSFEYIGPCSGRGGTIYFPARTSQFRRKLLRIYDKYIESGKDENQNCIRYEFSLNHQVADDFVSKLLSLRTLNFADIFRGYLRILDERLYNDTAKSPICKEWQDWLENLKFNEQIKIDRRPAQPKSIQEIKARFSAMFGAYVAHMKQLYGSSWNDMLSFWAERMTEEQKHRIYLVRHYSEFDVWENDIESPFGDACPLPGKH